ncbi:hypothetical protein K7X08_005267 [Anisodus acutangulus]|uniref:Uncharacterized protein n=1 Tax=Anisodus acutangulus TaxID=402998 RepID=A0A9Q1LUI7_9SOLA|nr:hypothetical protein K7X08_005267 [Anisodus acutangulus]
MAAANANLLEPDDTILKDVNDIKVDDDSKANSGGSIQKGVGDDEIKDQSDEDDMKSKTSTCDDAEEDVKEMNNDKEAMEEVISNIHMGDLPTITGKEAKKPVLLLNNLRCRGRSTLLLFYRLWREHHVKKPCPPPM